MKITCCALLLLLLACGPRPSANPASLWVYHGEREVDLVLVDFEPPPF